MKCNCSTLSNILLHSLTLCDIFQHETSNCALKDVLHTVNIVNHHNLSLEVGNKILTLVRDSIQRHGGDNSDISKSFFGVIDKLDKLAVSKLPVTSSTIKFDESGILVGLPDIDIE